MNERTMLLSVSIVTFQTPWDALESAIRSLLLALEYLETQWESDFAAEIAVVDNSNTPNLTANNLDSLSARLPDSVEKLTLIEGHGNVGYGAAHNLAMRHFSSKYCLFLNPDVELDPHALSAGLQHLRINKDLVALSPSATNATGDKQYLCKQYPSVLDFLLRGFAPRKIKNIFEGRMAAYEMRELPIDQAVSDIPIISGCCILARSSAVDMVGGFDDKYFLYFEDFDLSLRLASIGKLAYLPSMKIRHTGGNAARKGLRHILMFSRSAIRFFNTHGWLWH